MRGIVPPILRVTASAVLVAGIAVVSYHVPSKEEGPSGESGTVQGALQGHAVGELTPQIARQLNRPPRTTGVVATDVPMGSAAADAGLRRGDVMSEFGRAMSPAGNQPVLLLINREGNTLFVVVEAQ